MKKIVTILALVLVALFLVDGVFIVQYSTDHNILIPENHKPVIKGYISHRVIRINNDTDFANQAAAEGWPGDGTQSSPYMISGYDIDAHRAGDVIYIGNTTVYFVVENCYLHNASHHSDPYFVGVGLALYNVVNGKIKYNTINSNGWGGIRMYNSSKNIIWNNIFSNNYDGIALYHSNNNTISNNVISGNEYDLYIESSNKNIIFKNTISNSYWGIHLINSNSNVIKSNLISNNTDYGIYIDLNNSYNIIYYNSFYYNHGSEYSYNPSHIQAYDRSSNNYWNSTTGIGNYWLDWADNNNTNDQNHDGIVDWPYKIGNPVNVKDYYPLKSTSLKNVLSHPMNLTAIVGKGYINLTWKPPVYGKNTVTGYQIYRNGVPIKDVSAFQLWYNDTNVTSDQNYSYYVTAVNPNGESIKSNEVNATPLEVSSATQNSQTTGEDNYIKLAWIISGAIIIGTIIGVAYLLYRRRRKNIVASKNK